LIRLTGLVQHLAAYAAKRAAYHAVLQELRLVDCEDAGTLMVAKHIVELAGQGERDAQRLAEAALAKLSR
jgi:hypothetical protein